MTMVIKNKKTGATIELTLEQWEKLKRNGWDNYWFVSKKDEKQPKKEKKAIEIKPINIESKEG